MPNPTGINQYSKGGAGGENSGQSSQPGNAHPDHAIGQRGREKADTAKVKATLKSIPKSHLYD